MPLPPKAASYTTGDADLDKRMNALIAEWDVTPEDGKIYYEMMVTIRKLAQEQPNRSDLRLFNTTLKELRYANKVFSKYRDIPKIVVFGSARTSPDVEEYKAARKFGAMMRDAGFMIITGGGDGIMGAAQAGAGAEKSFGLNIQLPFEQRANETIHGDAKLINFRYFFTRKLNFVKETHAIALFPGGFGTMDEGFEALTLMQTGKAKIVPFVLVDAPGGNFWNTFERYLREHLLNDGLISKADFNLFKVTDSLEVAQREVQRFYYNFHSYRFVGDQMVIRLQRPVPPGALLRLKEDFEDILPGGKIDLCPALPEEVNEPKIADLPRLCLSFDRRSFGRFRQLIDRLNDF